MKLRKKMKLYHYIIISIVFNTILFATPNCQKTQKIQAFVERFYTVVLDRRADNKGLDSWTNNLISGALTGADVANGFVFSKEFIDKNTSNKIYVKTLYKAFFNRKADKSGFNGWIKQLNSGIDREDVLYGFLHSQEFINLANVYGIKAYDGVKYNSPLLTAFVKRFYKVVLDRDADEVGLKDWTDKLRTQVATGSDIAIGFVFSNEYNEKSKTDAQYLTTLYKAFFDRKADATGFNGWMEQLSDGVSRKEVLQGFLHAQEFINLANSFNILAFEGAVKKIITNNIENNLIPVVKAGLNQNIDFKNSVILDGSSSYDPDGNLTCVWWIENSVLLSEEYTFEKDNLILGQHDIRLTIVDNNGVSQSDSVVVNVRSAVDTQVPIITLLGDREITLYQNTNYIDAGATASDNINGNITLNIIINNLINTNILGTYTITYDVNDSAGNQAQQVTRVVHVIEAVSVNRLEIKGISYFNNKWNINYLDVKPNKTYGTEIVYINNEVNREVNAGTTSSSRGFGLINIYDTSLCHKAYIVLYDKSEKEIQRSDTFVFGDVTKCDKEEVERKFEIQSISYNKYSKKWNLKYFDVELNAKYSTEKIFINNSLDRKINAGNQKPSRQFTLINTYNASQCNKAYMVLYDKNENEIIRSDIFVFGDTTKCNVVPDTQAPVITLNGNANISLTTDDTYTERGATAIDNVDGTVAVTVSGNVDTTTAGTYTLTYTAVDNAGNVSTLQRVIIVRKVGGVVKLDIKSINYYSNKWNISYLDVKPNDTYGKEKLYVDNLLDREVNAGTQSDSRNFGLDKSYSAAQCHKAYMVLYDKDQKEIIRSNVFKFGDITKCDSQEEKEYTYTDTDCTIFISKNGNDTNDGTINKPIRTLKKALGDYNKRGNLIEGAEYGDVICIRGGVYREGEIRPYYNQDMNKIGKPQDKRGNKRLVIRNYHNEKVIFKGSVLIPNKTQNNQDKWELVAGSENVWKMKYNRDGDKGLVDLDTGLKVYGRFQQVFATPKNEYRENTTSNYDHTSLDLIGRIGDDKYYAWAWKYSPNAGPRSSSTDGTDLWENSFRTVRTNIQLTSNENAEISRENKYLHELYVRFPGNKSPSDYVIEISNYSYILDATHIPYMDFRGISFMHSNSSQFIRSRAFQGGSLLSIAEQSTVSDCEFAYADFEGLTLGALGYDEIRGIKKIGIDRHQAAYNNKIHHNGAVGLHSNGGGIHVYNNEFYKNGINPYHPQWHAAAIKCTTSAWGTIENNYIHDEYANGIWFDYAASIKNTQYDGTRTTESKNRNVITSDAKFIKWIEVKGGESYYEIIDNPTEDDMNKYSWKVKAYPSERKILIKGNLLYNIGIPKTINDPKRTVGLYGMGIFMEASENVELHDNVIIHTMERGIFLSSALSSKVYHNIISAAHSESFYFSSKLREGMVIPFKSDTYNNLIYNNKIDRREYNNQRDEFRPTASSDFNLEAGYMCNLKEGNRNYRYYLASKILDLNYGLGLYEGEHKIATVHSERHPGFLSLLGKDNYMRNNIFYNTNRHYYFRFLKGDPQFTFDEGFGLQFSDNQKVREGDDNAEILLNSFNDVTALNIAREHGIDYKATDTLLDLLSVSDTTPPVIGIGQSFGYVTSTNYSFIRLDQRPIQITDLVCPVKVSKFDWELLKDEVEIQSGNNYYSDKFIFATPGDYQIKYHIIAEDCNNNSVDKTLIYDYTNVKLKPKG